MDRCGCASAVAHCQNDSGCAAHDVAACKDAGFTGRAGFFVSHNVSPFIDFKVRSRLANQRIGSGADGDNDGMPDEWEAKNGLNPSNATDGNSDADSDGYTNIEEFLNSTDPKAKD